MTNSNLAWWQTGIVYQIYPRSYQDSNGDGIGDLPGITRRLDHIARLGVNTVWISPMYPSPMADFGYDVSDYCGINQMFGTMADFDHLLSEAHVRGLKVILDLVPSHTSHLHPWFLESQSNRDNPKRDWYIWRDPKPDGSPPNNWLSVLGGPAWTFDEKTGQYYMHSFLREQPELNWRNPQVRSTIYNAMRFWLDKGIDGFRVDVITRMIKDDQFRDEPPNPDWNGVNPYDSLLHIYTKNIPEVHTIAREMRALLEQYPDRVLIGETYLPNHELVNYYGAQNDECHLPFNFQCILLPWNAQTMRRAVDAYDASLPPGAWGNWVLGNHDQHRVATRAGVAQARVANMFLLTLRGTPTTYYGEEIGMQDGAIPPEFVQDPPALKQPSIAHIIGRDPERTPMQWDDSPNAGFARAGVRTWLPVADNYTTCNVAAQERDPGSMLNFYRALVQLRKDEPALIAGAYASPDAGAEDVFAYTRTLPGANRLLIVLNFGAHAHTLNLSRVASRATIAIATGMNRTGEVNLAQLDLAPNQGLVLRIV